MFKKVLTYIFCLAIFGAALYFTYRLYEEYYPAVDLTKVSISDVSQIRMAEVYIADEKGFFKNNGLDVDIPRKLTGKASIQQVLDGKLTFAVAAPSSLVPFMAKDSDMAVIAIIHYSDKNASVVARKDAGINKVEDLKGKRIGVQVGADSHYFLNQLLYLHGVNIKDVTIVNVKATDMLKEIEAKNIDAISSWSPQSTQVKIALGDNSVVFPSTDFYYSTLTIVAKKSWAIEHKDVVVKFLKSLKESLDYMTNNPEESFKLVAEKSMEIEPAWSMEDLKENWDASIFILQLDPSLVFRLSETLEWYIKDGLIERPTHTVNFLKFIYSAPLKEVAPNFVRIND